MLHVVKFHRIRICNKEMRPLLREFIDHPSSQCLYVYIQSFVTVYSQLCLNQINSYPSRKMPLLGFGTVRQLCLVFNIADFFFTYHRFFFSDFICHWKCQTWKWNNSNPIRKISFLYNYIAEVTSQTPSTTNNAFILSQLLEHSMFIL